MRKVLLSPNGGRCGGNGRRGGSMAGRGGSWLANRLIVSNEGCGGGGLVSVGVVMVPVVKKLKVEELFWECLRDNLVRFSDGEAGRVLTKQQDRTLIRVVLLNALAFFCHCSSSSWLMLVRFLKGMDEMKFEIGKLFIEQVLNALSSKLGKILMIRFS
nr:hypothetical protein [Tanacetum cinerariifolium]